jgi:uncharacterized protein (DUF4415 family)
VGFVSPDGSNWEDAESAFDDDEEFGGNVIICLKAFAEPAFPSVFISSNHPKAMFVGETTACQAYTVAIENPSIAWEASIGAINAQGVYTAPASVSGKYQMATITAKSAQNPAITQQVQIRINSDAMAAFDGNGPKGPQLLNFANAYGSRGQADLELYDLNGDGIVDDLDIEILFKRMGW